METFCLTCKIFKILIQSTISVTFSVVKIFLDISQNDKVNSLSKWTSQDLLKREHYADNTVKALRQFYKDSMLYFVELRK